MKSKKIADVRNRSTKLQILELETSTSKSPRRVSRKQVIKRKILEQEKANWAGEIAE